MNAENLIPTATSIGGGFFIGVMLGYFVKKIIEILMFFAGGIVGLLLYLHQQQIISINMERLEDSTTFIFTALTSTFEKVTQIGDARSLGIPLTASMTAGFTVAFMRG
jgi:uncharacterized membrane protein (Fun14 family)